MDANSSLEAFTFASSARFFWAQKLLGFKFIIHWLFLSPSQCMQNSNLGLAFYVYNFTARVDDKRYPSVPPSCAKLRFQVTKMLGSRFVFLSPVEIFGQDVFLRSMPEFTVDIFNQLRDGTSRFPTLRWRSSRVGPAWCPKMKKIQIYPMFALCIRKKTCVHTECLGWMYKQKHMHSCITHI